MRFNEVKSLIVPALNDNKWDVVPGPTNPDDLPHQHVICTPYGGPGEDVEGVIDQVSWQLRIVGPQEDYQATEDAAFALDEAFLLWKSGYLPGNGRWLVSIRRVGGAPNALMKDDAERVHFIGNYIFTVSQPALVNN